MGLDIGAGIGGGFLRGFNEMFFPGIQLRAGQRLEQNALDTRNKQLDAQLKYQQGMLAAQQAQAEAARRGSWKTFEAADGIYRINPVTGEVRPVTVGAVGPETAPTLKPGGFLNTPSIPPLAPGMIGISNVVDDVLSRIGPAVSGVDLPAGGQRRQLMPKAKASDIPSSVREFLAYQQMPEENQEAFLTLQKATRGGANVNVGLNMTQQKAEDKAAGEMFVDEWKDVRLARTSAARMIPALDALRSLDLPDGDALLPIKNQFWATTKALGLPVSDEAWKNVTNAATFQALVSEQILGKAEQMKGQLSDRDVKFLEASVAGITNPRQARDFLLAFAKARALRDIERANFYDDYRRRAGTLDGADSAWVQKREGFQVLGKRDVGDSNPLPVIWYDFAKRAQDLNPQMTLEQIRQEWNTRYALH